MRNLRQVLLCVFVLAFASSCFGQEQKLQPSDIVARHLESIGTAQARAAAKSRSLRGRVAMNVIVGSAAHLEGSAMSISDARRYSIMMRFNTQNYPGEQFLFDGKPQVATITPNHRSPLGDFLYSHDEILRDGLLGGSMLTTWALLDPNTRQARLKYEGLKKIGERQLHDVTYSPKKGDAELLIHLYFEPDTFRHVKTVYKFTVPEQFSHNQRVHGTQLRYEVEEDFGEFRVVNGLTLPYKWTLRLTANGERTTTTEWSVDVDAIAHNNVVD